MFLRVKVRLFGKRALLYHLGSHSTEEEGIGGGVDVISTLA